MIDVKSAAYGEGVCAYGRGASATGCLYERGSVKWGQWRAGWEHAAGLGDRRSAGR